MSGIDIEGELDLIIDLYTGGSKDFRDAQRHRIKALLSEARLKLLTDLKYFGDKNNYEPIIIQSYIKAAIKTLNSAEDKNYLK